MDNEVFDIEELLKTHLSDGQQHSNEDLFPKIEEKLLKRKRKRRFLWIFFWLGLGAGLMAAGIFLWGAEKTCECEEGSTSDLKRSELVSEKKNDPKMSGQNDAKINLANRKSMLLMDKESSEKNDEPGMVHMRSAELNEGRGKVRSGESRTVKSKVESSVDATPDVLAFADETDIGGGDSKVQEISESTNENEPVSNDSVPNPKKTMEDSTTADLPSMTVEEQDFVILLDSINPESKTRFALFVHGGPTMYDMTVFKPYFTSGVLSNRSFRSSGWDLTLGASKPLGDHLDVQFSLNYNQKNTRFSYDLLVGEEEYMNLQIENQAIALEQLDQENSCNCFLAKDASLEYGVSTVSLMTGIDYRPFLWEKVRLSTSFQFGTNALTNFKSGKQQVVEFPSNTRELFSIFSMRFGLTLGYNIRKNLSVNLYPGYTISLAGRSDLYARNIRELIIPIGLRMEF